MEQERALLVARFQAASDKMGQQMQQAAMQESMQDWVDVDLTMPQMRTLALLMAAPQRMGELATLLGISVSSATSLIERLEGKDLVQRQPDPHDRRAVICHLLPLGRQIIDRFWERQRLKLNRVADRLTVPELAQVVAAIELLATAINRPPVASIQEPETISAAAHKMG